MIEAAARGVIEGIALLVTLFVFGLLGAAALRFATTGRWRLFPAVRTGFESPEEE